MLHNSPEPNLQNAVVPYLWGIDTSSSSWMSKPNIPSIQLYRTYEELTRYTELEFFFRSVPNAMLYRTYEELTHYEAICGKEHI